MAFDPWTVGLTVLGGLFSSRSSSKAADANLDAQREALALQERMFQQARQDYMPWLQAGAPALNEMMRMVGLSGMTPSIGQSAAPTAGSPATGGGGSAAPVRGSLSDTLNPFAAGSPVPGGPSIDHMGRRGERGPLDPTIGEFLMGSRPSAHPGAVNQFQNVHPVGFDTNLSGNLFTGRNNAEDAIMYAMAPAVGAEVETPTPDLNTNLSTIMGNRQTSPYGTPVTAMGAYRSPAGHVTGTIGPDDVRLTGAIDGHYMTPAMQAAAQRYQEQAAITPRFMGGGMFPGNIYSVAELEPELVTGADGSQQLMTQPTVVSPSQPMQVTPGPVGNMARTLSEPAMSLQTQRPLSQAAQPVQTGGSGGAMQPGPQISPSPVMAPTQPAPQPAMPAQPAPPVGGFAPTAQPAPPMAQPTAPVQTGGSGGMMQPGPIPAAQQPTDPWNVSSTTTPQLQDDPYSFVSDDPSYGFRFTEGQTALERSAAARGGLLSGGTAKRLARYGQDYASTEYMNRFNRLASIAGMGQTMTSNMGQLGFGYGGNMGNIIGGMGQTRASGYLGQGSAMGGSLQNLAFLRALGGG